MTTIQILPRWLRDFVPLILWMGLLYYLSDQPTLIEIESDVEEKIFYKAAHMIAYGALAWLWWRALTRERLIEWPILGTAFILTVLYGVTDEYHQLFVPGRHGKVTDVLFDGGGALIMLLLIRRIEWLRTLPETIPLLPTKN